MKSTAFIEGPYRYHLTREWGLGHRVVFIMLNPSKADAEKNDPTVESCIRLATTDGAGSIEVVNLFAWRATDPQDLLAAIRAGHDVVGPYNDRFITEAAMCGSRVVMAWGAMPVARVRGHQVWSALIDLEIAAYILGRTKDGAPKHPLFIPAATRFIPG